MEKFTYFDFIVHIIPGALLLGTVSLVVGSNSLILITSNAFIDTLLLLVTSFAIGAFLHQVSNYSVEPLVKRLFWHGKFYSEIYLIKRYGLCSELLRTQIINTAESLFKFDRASLSSLELDTPSKESIDHAVSHQIYRRFDYFTTDHDLAKKGHTANTLYSLYRTLTLTTLILAIVFGVSYFWGFSAMEFTPTMFRAILCLLGSIVFLLRTRSEGQRYIQGVLSVTPKE